MLVDKEGVLRYIHYGHSMKDIPENQEILDIIDKISVIAPEESATLLTK